MAFALLAFDIVLRLAVIEKRTAMLYIDRDGADLGPLNVEDAAAPREDLPTTSIPLAQEENIGAESRATVPEASKRRSWVGKLPPVVTLLRYPRFLNALWASLIQAVISTGFETTVSNVPITQLPMLRWRHRHRYTSEIPSVLVQLVPD
jgi:hypothetical protein